MIKKFVVFVSAILFVAYFVAALLFMGGLIFGANMDPYTNTMTAWGIYAVAYMLGIGAAKEMDL